MGTGCSVDANAIAQGDAALSVLIKGAREARLSSFRECRVCGRSVAPEWMDLDGVCHPCAQQERLDGIVH